jgi:hypothetical protein
VYADIDGNRVCIYGKVAVDGVSCRWKFGAERSMDGGMWGQVSWPSNHSETSLLPLKCHCHLDSIHCNFHHFGASAISLTSHSHDKAPFRVVPEIPE